MFSVYETCENLWESKVYNDAHFYFLTSLNKVQEVNNDLRDRFLIPETNKLSISKLFQEKVSSVQQVLNSYCQNPNESSIIELEDIL